MLSRFLFPLTFFVTLLLPSLVSAAQMTFETVSDTQGMALDVWVNPEGKKINVIEGTLVLRGIPPSVVAIVDIEGSRLTLWPTPPVYSPGESVIPFVGGAPGGFTEKGKLFRIHFSSPLFSPVSVSLAEANAYLNDGVGTRESLFALPYTTGEAKQTGKNIFSEFFSIKNVTITVLLFSIVCFVLW
jgi:hypothetical protein